LPSRGEIARQLGLQAAAALPIRFGSDVIAVLELFSDQPHPPNEVLETLMTDVSVQIGKVLERERSTAQMADLVWREQQGLLHTLHDSLGQTLTGLGMLATGLSQRVRTGDDGTIETAKQIALHAQLALEEVRQLARNLFPLEVEAHSLMAALQQLAATTELLHKIQVHIDGAVPDVIRDGTVATQLYRIVQEAITNVVKHAHARTVRIHIGEETGMAIVRITDDGVGIHRTEHKHDGVGLGIMKYRAKSIGGLLVVEPGTDRGTIVTCTLRGIPHLSAPYIG
jgi:signal transduction histidine kinase